MELNLSNLHCNAVKVGLGIFPIVRFTTVSQSGHIPLSILKRSKQPISPLSSKQEKRITETHHPGDIVLMYHQILTTHIKWNVWQPVRRIDISRMGLKGLNRLRLIIIINTLHMHEAGKNRTSNNIQDPKCVDGSLA